MTSHPSFGPVPEEDFKRAQAAPAFETRNIIRKHVPTFGLEKGQHVEFVVKVSRELRVTQEAQMVIAADSKEELEKKVDDMSCEDWDWDEVDSDTYSFDVDEIKPKIVETKSVPKRAKA